MSKTSMVCNGHKEHIEKNNDSLNDVFLLNESSIKSDQSSRNIMTIGRPFRDFDHVYASSGEDLQLANRVNMDSIMSHLHSCHLDIIEEQARIIESQNEELVTLKKRNNELLAKIERTSRNLETNLLNQTIIPHKNKLQRRNFSCLHEDFEENPVDKEVKRIRIDECFSEDEEIVADVRSKLGVSRDGDSNFHLQCIQKEITVNNGRRRGNKMVRFVEAKRSNYNQEPGKQRRLSAHIVDEELKKENAVLYLNSVRNDKFVENSSESIVLPECEGNVLAKRKIKLSVLTSLKPYYMAAREDLYDPVTYTPTALEVPSFRTLENLVRNLAGTSQSYDEDVSLDAAQERHLRFENDEKKRKRWDVQRIRELRQNERLKEKIRRQKSHRFKMESPNSKNNDIPDQITSLFPDIRNIEKILVTDLVPVTALGCSIRKIPSWGSEFCTHWKNDGSIDVNQLDDNSFQSHMFHHKDSKKNY